MGGTVLNTEPFLFFGENWFLVFRECLFISRVISQLIYALRAVCQDPCPGFIKFLRYIPGIPGDQPHLRASFWYWLSLSLIYTTNTNLSYKDAWFYCEYHTKTSSLICACCLLSLNCVYCLSISCYCLTYYSSGRLPRSSGMLSFRAWSAICLMSSCDNAGVLAPVISIRCGVSV